MASNDSIDTRNVRAAAAVRTRLDEGAQKTLCAGGSAIGAIAMSSCCILPLVLFSVGVTGAWIGNLTALYPYKPYFFIATAGFLVAGFWKVYRQSNSVECADGSYCASALSNRVNKIVLWSATMLVLTALVFPYTVPLFFET